MQFLTAFSSEIISRNVVLQGWYMDERQRAIKVALTMMFEQHPPLMRALLDTGDTLLVYCSRYSSLEAELTIGMRERDLRAWLAQIDIDTRQVILQITSKISVCFIHGSGFLDYMKKKELK